MIATWEDGDTWRIAGVSVKNWKELQQSPELQKLIAAANESLASAAAAQPKGKGKGYANSEQR